MNRIEIVGLFTAMDSMMEKKDYESLDRTIKAVLNEAITKQTGKNSKRDDEK